MIVSLEAFVAVCEVKPDVFSVMRLGISFGALAFSDCNVLLTWTGQDKILSGLFLCFGPFSHVFSHPAGFGLLDFMLFRASSFEKERAEQPRTQPQQTRRL